MFLSFHPLCLKDELSVTFSQSFLLTNLGKVNGSVHVPLCPLYISESWHLHHLVIVKSVTHATPATICVFFKSSTIVSRSSLLTPVPPCVLSQGHHSE